MRGIIVAAVLGALAGACGAPADELGPTPTPTERPDVADSRLLDGLTPDSTFHQVQFIFDSTAVHSMAGFELPDRYRQEAWIYFEPDGGAVSLYMETRDPETGGLILYAVLEDDLRTLRVTIAATGETRLEDTGGSGQTDTVDAYRRRLERAQMMSAAMVPAGVPPAVVDVGGRRAYVVEEQISDGVRRTFIDTIDFRTLKWERTDRTGAVIEGSETPVLEFLPGNHLPPPQP